MLREDSPRVNEPFYSTQKFHRQARKDRKESPTLIRSEELPDPNLPDHISEFSYVSGLNMGGFFAGFACFAVKLHCLGSTQIFHRKDRQGRKGRP